jgi:hypothetical protein
MNDMLRANLYLKAVLQLMEDLVEFDSIASAAISGKRLILQFEVKNGPSAHLMIDKNKIRRWCRFSGSEKRNKHKFPWINKTPPLPVFQIA